MTTATDTKPESRPFEADVARLLHLMVHSVYSDKSIFLRELIANAADACERLRYEAIAAPALLGDDPKPRIIVALDARQLAVEDNGIGMSRDELIDALGTIARSGTKAFLERIETGKSGEGGEGGEGQALIGRFGVGFYSAFMVADRVEVLSRKAGDSEGWRWVSDGKGSFTIEPAANVPRGARITLHMREGDEDYLEPHRIRQIVKTYSDHIALPIVLADGNKEETINSASALWTRPRSEITAEQYNALGTSQRSSESSPPNINRPSVQSPVSICRRSAIRHHGKRRGARRA